jgi:peptidoglycan/LPS O-acetylase OafA/YrhL
MPPGMVPGPDPCWKRHADYLRAARFPSLDGLRCLSIVPVIWHHATPGPLPGVLGKGPVGVDLFFAISGFLITTLLLRERDLVPRPAAVSIRRFYARRALRIFPLYYAVLGLYVVRAWLLPAAAPERAHFFASLPFWATYTANWLVDFGVPHPVLFAFGWSLATEEQFYLVWPWIVRATRGLRAPAGAALFLLVADQSMEQGLFPGALPPGSLGRRMIASIASPILLGALLACALHRPRGFAAAARILGHRASAPVLLLAVAALLAVDGAPLLALELALALLVGACCVRRDHGLAAITDAAPVRWVGTVSYGMYLIHVSAITAAKRLLPAAWSATPCVFALAFALTLAAAAASYRWFERPFLKLGARFRPGG